MVANVVTMKQTLDTQKIPHELSQRRNNHLTIYLASSVENYSKGVHRKYA